MEHEGRTSETPTVEALVSAFEQGAVSRREGVGSGRDVSNWSCVVAEC